MALDAIRRINLGKLADDYLKGVISETQSVEEAEYLKSRIHSLTKPPDEIVEPMTDVEAREFEKVKMPFGKKTDWPIGEIHTDYLCNLFDPDPFMKKLKRYVEWRIKNEKS